MPVVLTAKITHLQLVFTPADLAVLAVWRKGTAALTSPCLQGKLSVVPAPLNPGPRRGTSHCPLTHSVLVIFFSSPISRDHKLIVLRAHPNSHFLIASHYLWDVDSSAGCATAQQTETRPSTWWRGCSPRSQPTYVNPARWFCALPSFKGREKKHSQGDTARCHTNPNKQISYRKL